MRIKVEKNLRTTEKSWQDLVSGKNFDEACVNRLAEYLRIGNKAGQQYPCFNKTATRAELQSGQVTMDGTQATVRIDGPLDWYFGIDVNMIIKDLDEMKPESIDMRINSPGGFLFDGLYMYNDLRSRAEAGVEISARAQGVVGSAAVLPFLAADTRTMPEGSVIFTHMPYTAAFLFGNVEEMEDQFTSVKKGLVAATDTMVGVYVNRLGQTREQVESLLSEDQWFNPTQAEEQGFLNATEEEAEDADATDAVDIEYKNQAQEIMDSMRLRSLVGPSIEIE